MFSSLGLANPPRIRFLQKAEQRAAQQKSVNDVDDTRLSDTEANFNDDDASDDGEFLTVKRRDVQIPEEEMAELDDDLEKVVLVFELLADMGNFYISYINWQMHFVK